MTWTLLERWKSYGIWRWLWYYTWSPQMNNSEEPDKNKQTRRVEIQIRNETIQTIAQLRSAIILRRVPDNWVDLQSPRLHWKPPVITDMKNL